MYIYIDKLYFVFSGLKCRRYCSVLETRNTTAKTCQFPFIYKNKTHNRCTDEDVNQTS